MASPDTEPVRIKPKKLFRINEATYNNRLVWGDLDESPDGKELFRFTGTVVRITDHGVVLFVPLSGVRKVFVESQLIRDSPFLKENGVLKLGQWMTVECEKRSEKESDFMKPPVLSHLAVGKPLPFRVEECLPGWQQRSHAGVFEFLVTADLSQPNTVQMYRIGSKKVYCVVTEFKLEVLVPCYRLDPFVSSVSLTGDRRVRFWATRASMTNDRFCLYLVDNNPMEEILPSGEIVFLGSGRRMAANAEYKKGNKELDGVAIDSTPRSSSVSSATVTNDRTPTPVSNLDDGVDSAEDERKKKEKPSVASSEKVPESETPKRPLQPTFQEVLDALAVLNSPQVKDVIVEEGLLHEHEVLMEWAKELKAGRASYP